MPGDTLFPIPFLVHFISVPFGGLPALHPTLSFTRNTYEMHLKALALQSRANLLHVSDKAPEY